MTKETFKLTAFYIAINLVYEEYSLEDASQYIQALQLSDNAGQYLIKEINRIFPYHYNEHEEEKRRQQKLDEQWALYKQSLYRLLRKTYELAITTGSDKIIMVNAKQK
ncbi:hypothetical protein [Megamonas hypermegale]|uniref:hypothetical protein n=1 Tax=Megamonas hypermegale TaxID=158847 RepID=UPI0019572A23|nr:hypothetical protein [Megamonas hypermegale]MBM6761681.1 hypothetical protein [Megamonas hypermegale]